MIAFCIKYLKINLFKLILVTVLSTFSYYIIDYLISLFKYSSNVNNITFTNLSKNFNVSPITFEIAHEYPNEDFHNFIKLEFEITTKNSEDKFLIDVIKPLDLMIDDSKSEDINIKLLKNFHNIKRYEVKLNQISKTKVNLFFKGDVFSGNSFNKLFHTYIDLNRGSDENQTFIIKPVISAITDVHLSDSLSSFNVDIDSLHYKVGKYQTVENVFSFYFRFTDLKKQGESQSLSILLSTILGVMLSFIITILISLINHNNSNIYTVYVQKKE